MTSEEAWSDCLITIIKLYMFTLSLYHIYVSSSVIFVTFVGVASVLFRFAVLFCFLIYYNIYSKFSGDYEHWMGTGDSRHDPKTGEPRTQSLEGCAALQRLQYNYTGNICVNATSPNSWLCLVRHRYAHRIAEKLGLCGPHSHGGPKILWHGYTIGYISSYTNICRSMEEYKCKHWNTYLTDVR